MEIRGDIVKALRTEKNWTQAQLAEICDLNLRTIQRVENQGNASVETVMALCVAFGVKRQTLFKVPEPEQLTNDPIKFSRTYIMVFVLGLVMGVIATIVSNIIFGE